MIFASPLRIPSLNSPTISIGLNPEIFEIFKQAPRFGVAPPCVLNFKCPKNEK